jgi:transposase
MGTWSVYEELVGLSGLRITGVRVDSKEIEIDCEIREDFTKGICPKCKKLTTVVNQRTSRRIRDLDISGRAVFLKVSIRQYYCSDCNDYFGEDLWFADKGKSYTKRESKYIFLLCKKQSYTEIGGIVGMSHKTVERLVLAECQACCELENRYKQVRRLGIDEQSHRKGKGDYFCVLSDLDRGIVVDILPSRTKEYLIRHFKERGVDFCTQITDVSCDIWDGYIGAAGECFPQATLVLDRFHVTKLLNEDLDNYLKTIRKEHKTNPLLKGLKWIIFKQFHRLSDQQLDRLEAAMNDFPHLKVLYQKREAFHHILDNSPTVELALAAIKTWLSDLKQQGIQDFDVFAKMLAKRANSIANFVKDYLSNAVTEGLNNLIRSVRRIAFGLTNFQHLRLRVLAISG